MGRPRVVDDCPFRRHLRPLGRLADRPPGPQIGDGGQHLRLFPVAGPGRPQHQPRLAGLLPLHDLRRGLCGIRGGHHLAVRAVPRQAPARAGPWLDPGVRQRRRLAGHRRQCRHRLLDPERYASRASRGRCDQPRLALHLDDRTDPRAANRFSAAVRPGIGGLVGAEARWHTQTGQVWRNLRPQSLADDSGGHRPERLCLCRRVRDLAGDGGPGSSRPRLARSGRGPRADAADYQGQSSPQQGP